MESQPQVVATAGHVDHGKSSLILRLTGMDPDRWAEEKRRGLTIDLGFAWCTLPSGREIGFVDVPGHERFVRNMLAGVGPVRLVLFVVAADEGWKPQSEEHLAIVDVLGAQGGVVALTKRDLVDGETLAIASEEVRDRVAGTVLEKADVVACSSVTGDGLDELRGALDRMIEAAPDPERDGRPRQFIDRIFSIRGAGTVVTGTLTGGPLEVGREVELYPTGTRARIRGLQSHKRSIEVARPVARVAVNLVGVERDDLERGDVLGPPGRWRPTSLIEASLRPVRGLEHPLTGRGAFKLYAGAAERDARIRFLSALGRGSSPPRDTPAYVRIRLSSPLVLDVRDRFVLREAGRRQTVAGGLVLDIDPPLRPGPDAEARLTARQGATREELPALLVAERGAVRAEDVEPLTGAAPREIPRALRAGAWWIGEPLRTRVAVAVRAALETHHREHPLQEGADLTLARSAVSDAIERASRSPDPGLVEALLDDLALAGTVVRTESAIRLATHRTDQADRSEVDRLVQAIAEAEPSPPTIKELLSSGYQRDVIDAAARDGHIVRISPDLVLTAAFVERAEATLRARGAEGITVSAFREAVGTSRKYAVPLLEYFDQRGVTRRQGDLRFVR
ncbi:MAG: selenocysteine-specific translation elongation factor [Actinobacteria bacterium]|nr:selenocysteine-specific translation elongation factor [Actinomycetota bacterium]